MTPLVRPVWVPLARTGALILGTTVYFALGLGLGLEVGPWAWFLLVGLAVAPLAVWLRGRRELAAVAAGLSGAILTLALSGPAALGAGGALVLALLVLLAPGVVEWAVELAS